MAHTYLAEKLIEANKRISSIIDDLQKDSNESIGQIIDDLNTLIRTLDHIVEELEKKNA